MHGLSPQLSKLVSDTNASTDELVDLIVKSPEMHREAVVCWRKAADIAIAPAGPDGVRAIIGRRLVTFPQGDLSDGEWTAWWGDYTETLSDLSAQSLEGGMRAWIAKPAARFMPKPGELRELARAAQTPDARIAHILSRAAALRFEAPAPPANIRLPGLRTLPPGPPPQSASDRARVRAMADDTIRVLGETTEAQRPKPRELATHGTVDASGITAEMRAHLQAQRDSA